MRLRPAEGLALGLLAMLAACGAPPGPVARDEAIAAIARRSVAAGGLTLSVLEAGNPAGRTLLFIHGTPGDATGWADYLVAPLPGFRVLAVDRPGFGMSRPDAAMPSLASQAAAIARLLPPGGRSVVVGHSLGAPIAAQIAVDNPGLVGALVLVAGSLDPVQEKIHWAQPIGAWGAVKALLPRSLRNANAELMALKPQLEALAPRLAGLQCPVVIVHGTRDQLVPYANVAFMEKAMPRSVMVLETLDGRDHFLPWNSRPELEAAIVRAAAMAGPAC